MPRTKEQFEEIRKEKSAHIRKVALELFATEGYHVTSISNIAKAANISKGLLYNYFESKEDLIRDIIHEGISESFESFDPNHDGVLTTEEFEFYIREHFRLIKKRKSFYKLFYTIIMQPDVQELANHESNDIAQNVQKLTYEYFAKRFDDPDTEMLLYSSIIKGLSIQYVFSEGYVKDEHIEKAIQRILEYYKK